MTIRVAVRSSAYGKQLLTGLASELGEELKFVSDPASAHLVCGPELVAKRVGSRRFLLIQARSPWSSRTKYRSSWDCYWIDDGGGAFITCLNPSEVRRGWAKVDRVRAALKWASLLAHGGAPLEPPTLRLTRAGEDTSKKTPWLALDVEGAMGSSPDRVALSSPSMSGTFRWDAAVSGVVFRATSNATTLLAWNWAFDRESVAKAGINLPQEKLWDCMVAHGVLWPTEHLALGHAAPMYLPTGPWKHESGSDPEDYSLKDGWILGPIYEAQRETLQKRGQFHYFTQHVMPAHWMFEAMNQRMVHVTAPENHTPPRSRSTVAPHVDQGAYGTASSATWAMDGANKALYPEICRGWWRGSAVDEAGRRLVFSPSRESIRGTIRRITGCEVPDSHEDDDWVVVAKTTATNLHMLGYGPGQIRDRTDLTFGEAKQIKAAFDHANPGFVSWRDKVRHHAVKDGFLQNTFGRRAWGLRDGICERFLIASDFTDTLIAEALMKETFPYALTSSGFLEVDNES